MEKLEKLEFGGVRGKSLSDQTVAIHQEFTSCWKIFKESSYDSFDVKNQVSTFHKINFNKNLFIQCSIYIGDAIVVSTPKRSARGYKLEIGISIHKKEPTKQ